MARLRDKIQNALDEARTLILGTQVLIGFGFRAPLEAGFSDLPAITQEIKLASLTLLLLTLNILLLPMAVHRLLEQGNDTNRLHTLCTIATGLALFPLVLSLSIDLFVAMVSVTNEIIAGSVAAAVALGGITAWFGPALCRRNISKAESGDGGEQEKMTPLSAKIRHVLTEARVVLPGAQALLGFSLIATLMDGFSKLPLSSKYIHLASLCMVAMSIILLITPAAYHRLVEGGEETERFHRLAGRLIIWALAPLAIGLSAEFYVAARQITGAPAVSAGLALLMLIIFAATWFGPAIKFHGKHRPTTDIASVPKPGKPSERLIGTNALE